MQRCDVIYDFQDSSTEIGNPDVFTLPSYSDPALKHKSGRACLKNMICFFIPMDVKVAAGKMNNSAVFCPAGQVGSISVGDPAGNRAQQGKNPTGAYGQQDRKQHEDL